MWKPWNSSLETYGISGWTSAFLSHDCRGKDCRGKGDHPFLSNAGGEVYCCSVRFRIPLMRVEAIILIALGILSDHVCSYPCDSASGYPQARRLHDGQEGKRDEVQVFVWLLRPCHMSTATSMYNVQPLGGLGGNWWGVSKKDVWAWLVLSEMSRAHR